VTIFGIGELSGVPFLVMELVEGISLQDHLKAHRIFSPTEVARIGYQSALGLAAAHAMRLIHRDIKPANLLLDNSTQSIRITDFGLVRAVDQDFALSQCGNLLGTPLYMSPEQIDGKPLTTASDLFSLGSVLYTLGTGQVPFQAESLSQLLDAVAEQTPPPIQSRNPKFPRWLSQAIEKLHAKNPADRFSSASALAAHLNSSGRQ
jgi:eukaryotic-like serine/threonine-protein kinase